MKEIKPNPRQPRQRFDPEALERMTQSIEAFGVIQPIVVRPVGTEFELVAGERRWRAARDAGLEKIPAIIKESTETDSLEMALIENLHRDDLNGIEEAAAYQQLLEDFGITHEELSKKLGRSRVAITNTVRLLQLPAFIQKYVMEGKISTGHARALLALQENPRLQKKLAERIIKESISVRQTEDIAREGAEAEPEEGAARRKKIQPPDEALEMFEKLGEVLDARVKCSWGSRKGRLVIEFRGMDDLKRIYGAIAREEPHLE